MPHNNADRKEFSSEAPALQAGKKNAAGSKVRSGGQRAPFIRLLCLFRYTKASFTFEKNDLFFSVRSG